MNPKPVTRLTANDLREWVPSVQDGTRRRQGQEELLRRASALLAYWTLAEYDRHRLQFTSLQKDDVKNIVTFHFLVALDTIDVVQLRNSGINWIYNRVTSATRREIMDRYSTIRFSRYFIENARRTRAIIDALSEELGRKPTDVEIVERSKRPAGGLLGPKERNLSERSPLTLNFLKNYWRNSAALVAADYPEDYELLDLTDVARPGPDPDLLYALYEDAAIRGGVNGVNLNIVFALFGLHPYESSHTISETAAKFKVESSHVRACVRAWAVMCAQQGGPFHEALSEISESTLDDAGLLRTLYALRTGPTVGDWSVLRERPVHDSVSDTFTVSV